jgi:hypothetical protein
MGQRVLINETVELLFERTGHFAWTTGAWAIQQSRRSFMGKALDPLSQGRIGKVEGLGDGLDVLARDHLTDGLSPAKDSGLLGLFEYRL